MYLFKIHLEVFISFAPAWEVFHEWEKAATIIWKTIYVLFIYQNITPALTYESSVNLSSNSRYRDSLRSLYFLSHEFLLMISILELLFSC